MTVKTNTLTLCSLCCESLRASQPVSIAPLTVTTYMRKTTEEETFILTVSCFGLCLLGPCFCAHGETENIMVTHFGRGGVCSVYDNKKQ